MSLVSTVQKLSRTVANVTDKPLEVIVIVRVEQAYLMEL